MIPLHPLVRKCAAGGLAALVMLGASSCNQPASDTPDLIVLQTGRLRGNVYPPSLQTISPLQHYPYLAGYVRQVRDEAARTGAKVLLVDLGDSLGGSFASHATGYGNMITFFNTLDYDAVMLGNLDNNLTPETLSAVEAVVLNPFANAAGEPATEGTKFGTRIDLDGQPTVILANFYGDITSKEFPDRFPTWFGNTTSGVAPLRDYSGVVKSLGDRPPGTFTTLAWMKFESPKNPPAAFLESLSALGIDAILAHRIYSGRERDIWTQETFYDWKPPVSENILRNNGGFTVARLDLKKEGDSWKVLNQELVPMTANTAARDQNVVDAISQFSDEIEKADTFISEVPDNVSEEDILVSYLNALSQIPETDVAVYSKNSVRNNWPSGRLTASRVFNSLPWTTSIVQMDLTPDQLRQLGEIGGIVFLRKDGIDPLAPVTVTTSRFFASLLMDRLDLPADSIRDFGKVSEFDYFVQFLTESPKPLVFSVPAGWEFINPKG
jgi:hypothetical protein